MKKFLPGICITMLLSSCMVGPDYKPIAVTIPQQYKQAAKPQPGWKIATPADTLDRGCWWQIFQDPVLNDLEAQLNITNQNIASVAAQYAQSLAIVKEAKAALAPMVTGTISASRQKPSASAFNSTSGTGTGGVTPTNGSGRSLKPYSTYIISFNASWAPDIWGAVRRVVEADADVAQATNALLAATRLSAQATLAQDYFEVRTLDNLQSVLDQTVKDDRKLLHLIKLRYQYGIASAGDVLQTQSTLENAEVNAINNAIARAQYEHAIAVLMGIPPALFSIDPKVTTLKPPIVPNEIPSELLERRPDIAEAERQAAAQNAQIGEAVSNFFPVLTLTGAGGFQSNIFSKLISSPASFWMIGAQLMGTLIDGGLRRAQLAAAEASYDQAVANYRQTILNAFQNVEDGLVADRILRKEEIAQRHAVNTSRAALRYQLENYKSGTVDLTTVLVAQTNYLTTEQYEVNVVGRQMVTVVELITALGGGWDVNQLFNPPASPSPYFKN
ncbi:MAG: efflux transporter outer membrane subunit [Proteobacteria bacterium]|nr:efflux transporter outer membrane subunit [Pseudomonadota bacterium]